MRVEWLRGDDELGLDLGELDIWFLGGSRIACGVAAYIAGPRCGRAKAPSPTVIWRDFLRVARCEILLHVRPGIHLPGVVGWRRAYLEAMAIPDRAFAGVGRHFEILCEFEAVSGAGVFAQAAEHAARSVVGEMSEDFAAGGVVALPAYYDQIFGARESAQIAGNAEGFAGFWIDIQARGAAIALGDHGALERILLGVNIFWSLITEGDPHALQQVDQKNATQ